MYPLAHHVQCLLMPRLNECGPRNTGRRLSAQSDTRSELTCVNHMSRTRNQMRHDVVEGYVWGVRRISFFSVVVDE